MITDGPHPFRVTLHTGHDSTYRQVKRTSVDYAKTLGGRAATATHATVPATHWLRQHSCHPRHADPSTLGATDDRP